MSSAIASASRTMPGTCVAECSVSASPAGVVFGEARARLDGERGFAAHAEMACDAHRRGGKRFVDIAALEFAAHQHVGAGFVVQQRRAGDAPPACGSVTNGSGS